MLLDSSNGQTGDKVTLLSPNRAFSNCSLLTFSYHMLLNDSDTDGSLAVYRYTRLHTYDELLFEERGNHGDEWFQGEVCIPAGEYRLAFVGTVGLPSLSDIAIDNIELMQDEECANLDVLLEEGLVFLHDDMNN